MSNKKYMPGVGFMPDFHLPTASHMVNTFLAEGGVASGSIMQIGSGQAGTFKTSHLIQMAAKAQKGEVNWSKHVKEPYPISVAYIDAEGAVDNYIEYDTDTLEPKLVNPWFAGMGLDINKTYLVDADRGEVLWEAINDLIEYNHVKFVIMDSIHAVQSTSVHESEAGDNLVMAHAKLHTTELVKILPVLRKNNAILAAVNHKKVNMTPMGARGEKYGGGKAWEYYSKYIFTHSLGKSKSQLDGMDYIPLNITIEKSKGGVSYKTVSSFATQSYGIQPSAELIAIALAAGIIRKAGGWYKDQSGKTLSQGITSNLTAWCEDNKELIVQHGKTIPVEVATEDQNDK